MAQSVLGSVALHYRALWSRKRQLAGVQLFVEEVSPGAEGNHLLRTLSELWSGESPPVLLSARHPRLMQELLAHAGAHDPMIEVPARWLAQGATLGAVDAARERSARLVASGSPSELRALGNRARGFDRQCVQLDSEDAALALRASMQTREDAARGRFGSSAIASPVPPGSLVVGAAGRALVEHALDQQGAWAVADWPAEDILHRFNGHPVPPTRRAILRVMTALDQEQSLDRIEYLLAQEATLAYRLLAYLNSAGLGLRNGIASLRHGVMMLGYRTLNGWLAEQLTTASEDRDLDPVNLALGLRAALAAELMDAGVEDELRHEVFLTGMLSQIDVLQGQTLRALLSRIPLPERVPDALVRGTGPYAAVIRLAQAMERDPSHSLLNPTEAAGLTLEESNRALLRVLSAASAS
jgi:hypothetical protein